MAEIYSDQLSNIIVLKAVCFVFHYNIFQPHWIAKTLADSCCPMFFTPIKGEKGFRWFIRKLWTNEMCVGFKIYYPWLELKRYTDDIASISPLLPAQSTGTTKWHIIEPWISRLRRLSSPELRFLSLVPRVPPPTSPDPFSLVLRLSANASARLRN